MLFCGELDFAEISGVKDGSFHVSGQVGVVRAGLSELEIGDCRGGTCGLGLAVEHVPDSLPLEADGSCGCENNVASRRVGCGAPDDAFYGIEGNGESVGIGIVGGRRG